MLGILSVSGQPIPAPAPTPGPHPGTKPPSRSPVVTGAVLGRTPTTRMSVRVLSQTLGLLNERMRSLLPMYQGYLADNNGQGSFVLG